MRGHGIGNGNEMILSVTERPEMISETGKVVTVLYITRSCNFGSNFGNFLLL